MEGACTAPNALPEGVALNDEEGFPGVAFTLTGALANAEATGFCEGGAMTGFGKGTFAGACTCAGAVTRAVACVGASAAAPEPRPSTIS